jgi:hypothetical protein
MHALHRNTTVSGEVRAARVAVGTASSDSPEPWGCNVGNADRDGAAACNDEESAEFEVDSSERHATAPLDLAATPAASAEHIQVEISLSRRKMVPSGTFEARDWMMESTELEKRGAQDTVENTNEWSE